MNSYVSFAVPATSPAAQSGRRHVLAFVRAHTTDPELELKLSRALSDALEPGACEIVVSADIDEGCLEVVVVKHGTGPDLSVIAECADAFAVREPFPGAVELWMRFNLEPLAG